MKDAKFTPLKEWVGCEALLQPSLEITTWYIIRGTYHVPSSPQAAPEPF